MWIHKQIKPKNKTKNNRETKKCRERRCKNIKVAKMLATAQKTSCPKNDDQHCRRKQKLKALWEACWCSR